MIKKLFKAAFKFKPFSKKQLQVLKWWTPESPHKNKNGIIADGAIRSGKTLVMSLSFVFWAMDTFNNQNFGMAGKTIGSFRRNVVFWLKLMLKSRGFKVEDKRSEKLLVIRRNGIENYFYIFGGKDESSQDLIQGITLAGMFFDEVALMPESFVNQATGRCSVEGSKYWFNCNPASPYHWFKTNWIDKKEEKNLLQIHFLMEDNLSLSKEIIERYKTMYKGVFYKRYILGLWVMAEGIIFSMFDDKKHVICRNNIPDSFDRKFVCIDFGASNPTTFLQYGVKDDIYYEIKEYYWDPKEKGDRTINNYAKDLINFIDGDEYAIFIDPSAKAFIIELKSLGILIVKAAVNNVLDGIVTVCRVIENNQLFVCEDNQNSIKEIYSYTWDSKAAKRGEDAPVKQDDHTCDARRYGIHTDYLMRVAKKSNEQRKSGENRRSR